MDKVRFGRALGAGAREAAKALLKAADAAAAPDPNAAAKPVAERDVVERAVAERPRATPRSAAAVKTRVATQGEALKRGGRRFGQSAWAPVKRAGGVLWLEVTGVLFGLFALTSGIALWRDRGNFRAGGTAEHHAWFALGMFAVFAYFTASSYIRASRRSRS